MSVFFFVGAGDLEFENTTSGLHSRNFTCYAQFTFRVQISEKYISFPIVSSILQVY